MWERTLQDLIRGLRANKNNEAKFLAKAIEEIRNEIKGEDMELKAGAVLKLTYLDMLGHDMTWASFHVVEVMSSSKFHLKSMGYLAAVQSFDQDTDVLMLTTNLLKKDLASNPADVAVTLNGISHIVTFDLARDLSPELIRLLNHSRPNIRKRAVIALYKAMIKFPDVFTLGLDRMKEKLEDSDPGVVAATVNVLCEISNTNPQSLLSIAPPLFHLMTTSSNNWMLIKIIKLFGSICPYEPRLVKKLQPPITDLISTTPAISLLYECVRTCIIGGMLQTASGDALARMCVSKLAGFIQDSDQNLKYIALLAMVKIVPTHAYLVAEYQDTILSSVNDHDISIRMRALDLISAMVNRSNLQSIVQQLLSHLVTESPSSLPTASETLSQYASSSFTATDIPLPASQSTSYRLVLCQRILAMGSQSTYDNVTNFEWYLSVLVDLAHVANVDVGAQIRDQLVDVVGRVRGVRRYAVTLMYGLLSDESMLLNADEPGSCSEVLWAAAWICGEYCSELVDPQKLIPNILRPEITALSSDTMALYVQSSVKIFGYWAADVGGKWSDDDLGQVKGIVELVINRLAEFAASAYIEVQERVASSLQLFHFIQADLNMYRPKTDNPFADTSSLDPMAEPGFPKSLYLILPLVNAYDLNPVASSAQASVPIPDGLNLDAWIVPPPSESTIEEKVKKGRKGKGKEVSNGKSKFKRQKDPESRRSQTPEVVESPEERAERERRKAERIERMREDPYYIMDQSVQPKIVFSAEDIDSIPIVALEGLPSLSEPVGPELPLLREALQRPSPELFYIEKDGEMPEGITPHKEDVITTVQPQPIIAPIPMSMPAFPMYEVEEDKGDTTGKSTPEPIKVTKVKKKGTGKKKRTAKVVDSTS